MTRLRATRGRPPSPGWRRLHALAVAGAFVFLAACGPVVAPTPGGEPTPGATPPATSSSGPAGPTPSAGQSGPATDQSENAAFHLRGEPATLGVAVRLRLMNALVEPSAEEEIPAGQTIEVAGTVGPGTYTVETGDSSCTGIVELVDGVETDVVVELGDGGGDPCATRVVGTHAIGEAHRFGPR